jgi:hypothetical protein
VSRELVIGFCSCVFNRRIWRSALPAGDRQHIVREHPGVHDSPIRDILDEYPTQLEDPLPLVLRPHRRRLIIIHRGQHLRDTAKVAPNPTPSATTCDARSKTELTTRLPRRRGRPGHGPRRTPCRAAGCRTSSNSKSHALTIYARRLP